MVVSSAPQEKGRDGEVGGTSAGRVEALLCSPACMYKIQSHMHTSDIRTRRAATYIQISYNVVNILLCRDL